MKQVLFILLVFISFQGFSQSVKVKKLRLEVMTKDLGKMTWYDAKRACDTLGAGWRLPTIAELEKIYKYKDKIGGFEDNSYWSSTENGTKAARGFGFSSGDPDGNDGLASIDKDYPSYVRAVRSLK